MVDRQGEAIPLALPPQALEPAPRRKAVRRPFSRPQSGFLGAYAPAVAGVGHRPVSSAALELPCREETADDQMHHLGLFQGPEIGIDRQARENTVNQCGNPGGGALGVEIGTDNLM